MPAAYSYAVIRVVPRVDRGEFLNAGILLHCHERRFLDVAVHLDVVRLLALFNDASVDLIQSHLTALCAITRGEPSGGPMAQLTAQQRFHWLVAPRSTIIQTAPAHSGVCEDPAATLKHLMTRLVLPG